MSTFSDEQRKELERCVNAANQLGTHSARVFTTRTVADAIVTERERLAHIVESCKPITDPAAGAPSGVKDEIPDLEATLRALGRAIRIGRHE
jgi:HAMP domain-containing protein